MRFPPNRKPMREMTLEEIQRERSWWETEHNTASSEQERERADFYLKACDKAIRHKQEMV